MKLWILLDEKVKKEQIQPEDVILATWASKERLIGYKNPIIITNFSVLDKQPHAANIVKEIFNQLPGYTWIYKNTFYMSIVRPACAIIYQVHMLLEDYNVDEVVLVGGSNYTFMSTYRTNGEGKQICYKTSWLVNSLLAAYLPVNYAGVNLIWRRKKFGCLQHLLNIVRENFCLFKMVLLEIRKGLIYKNDSQITEDDLKNISSVGIAYMDLQFNHLKLILGRLKKSNAIIVTNKVNLKSSPEIKTIRIKPNSPKKVIYYYFQIKKRVKEKKSLISILGITISNRDIYRSLYNEMLSQKLLESNFINAIEKLPNVNTIYTNGTFGTEMIWCQQYAHLKRIKHINYQYVSMDNMIIPVIDLADEYYLYARKIYELYHSLSDSYKFYLPIYREPRRGNKDNLIISIFLQPDDYANRYIKLMKKFIPIFEGMECIKEVFIKPHYRQLETREINDLVEKTKKFKMCRKGESATEIIKKVDIIMSISSSVLFEAVSYGTPGIIADIDKLEREIIFSNNSYGEEVNFYMDDINTIIALISDYDAMFDEYMQRRKKFLSQTEESLC